MEEECHAPRSMWRAVLIGCLLIPVNIAWLVQVEYVRYSDNVSTSSLFFNTLTLLLVFTGINRLVSAWKPRWALQRAELLLVYVMLVVSTGLAGHDQLTILFATLSYPIGRANPVNGWETTLIPLIPAHLLPQSGEAVKAMYHGQSTLYTWEHIRAWISPVLWWSAFTAAAVWVMLCLSAIFRRQWEAERLSYPMAEIALQLTDPRSGILRNRLFWLAFSLAVVIRCLVFAHILYPSIPELPVGVRYYHLSTSMPWLAASGIGGGIPVQFFPFAIGLCFFLPAHLSFSIWFFILLTRLELVVAAMAGYTDFGQFPYILEQSAGGAIGLGLMVIWAARRHLLAVGRHALGMERMDDSNEPMGYPHRRMGRSGRILSPGGLLGVCRYALADRSGADEHPVSFCAGHRAAARRGGHPDHRPVYGWRRYAAAVAGRRCGVQPPRDCGGGPDVLADAHAPSVADVFSSGRSGDRPAERHADERDEPGDDAGRRRVGDRGVLGAAACGVQHGV